MSTPSTCERPSAERAAAGRRTRTATQAQALPERPCGQPPDHRLEPAALPRGRRRVGRGLHDTQRRRAGHRLGAVARAVGKPLDRMGGRRRGARRGRGGAHGRGAGRARLHADTSGRGRRGAVLRGLLELHAVAAFPRLSPEHALRPEGVGGLCPRERAVLRRRGRGRAPGRRGVGPGLPPDASAFARAGGGARGAGGLLFAHPLP